MGVGMQGVGNDGAEPDTVAASDPRTAIASTARPSDEDILNFENQIREEQVNVHPLASTRLPIGMLEEEYAPRVERAVGAGDSVPTKNNFVPKIKELDATYDSMRRLRGDGNCFYRAISYGLVESVASLESASQREALTQALDRQLSSLLQEAGFDRMAYEDFYAELLEALRDPVISSTNDHLAELWAREPHRSHSLVVLLRLATSAYLRAHASEYEPFIWEAGLDMIGYCQRHVECLGVESDQIHAIALGKALEVDLEIAYLDGSPGPLSCLSFPAREAREAPLRLSLLYRPGHYDLLYRK